MTNRPGYIQMVACLAVVAVLGLGNVRAQEPAVVTGSVCDQSGSALPGATVMASRLDGSSAVVTVTGADGSFRFIVAPAVAYKLSAELAGFKPTICAPVSVDGGSSARWTLEMSWDERNTMTCCGGDPLVDLQAVSHEPENLPVLPRRRSLSELAGPE